MRQIGAIRRRGVSRNEDEQKTGKNDVCIRCISLSCCDIELICRDQLGLSPKKQARIRNLLKDVLQDPLYNRRQYPVDTFDMDELMDRTDAREAGDNYADEDDEIEFPTDEPRSDVPRAAAMDMPRNEARMADDEESMPPMHNHPITTTPTAPTSFWQRTNWYYTTTILVTCVVAAVLGILLLVMSWLFCCYNTPKAVAYKNSSPTYLPTTNVNPNVGEYKSPTVVVSSGPNTTPVYQFKH